MESNRLSQTQLLIASIIALLTLFLCSNPAFAAGSGYDNSKAPHESPYKAEPPTGGHSSLAAAATNPIANLIQVQFQDQYNWSNHNADGYSNVGIFQPVIPFKLPWKSVPSIVTRTTFTYVTTPDLGDPVGRVSGLGDTTIIAPLIPKLDTKGVMIGIGPALSIPTASEDETGSGKWSGGPTFVYFNGKTKGWQWGFLGWHLWDFAGDDDRAYVNTTYFQPFVTKHLSKGWYVGSVDVPGTYNWRSQNVTFPIGLKVGRVAKLGKQPVNIFGEVFASPWDDGPSPEWSVKLSLTLLFPE
jgi:hypothetical protein